MLISRKTENIERRNREKEIGSKLGAETKRERTIIVQLERSIKGEKEKVDSFRNKKKNWWK